MAEVDDAAEDAGELCLMRFVLGSRCFIPIDEPTAASLQQAMDDLHEMVDVEQKFDILLENFLELETEMTTRLLRQAYRSDHSAREFYDDKLAFNRRIINVLTATRLYIDQAAHHIGVFFPGDPQKATELKSHFSHEYDAVLGYRVMEALRNFAQHRGLPLQSMTQSTSWIESDVGRQLQFNLALNLVVADLDGPGGLKKAVLKELQARGETVDVKVMLREYVEALARIHSAFRTMLAERIDGAKALVSEWRARFEAECRDEFGAIGLAVGRRRANGAATKIVSLHRDPIDSIEALRSRTSSLASLSKRTITTAPLPPKA